MSSRCKNNKEVRSRTNCARVLFYTHLLPSGLYRWSRSFTGSADAQVHPVADFTASGEFHPALKTFGFKLSYRYYILWYAKLQPLYYPICAGQATMEHDTLTGDYVQYQLDFLCTFLYYFTKK